MAKSKQKQKPTYVEKMQHILKASVRNLSANDCDRIFHGATRCNTPTKEGHALLLATSIVSFARAGGRIIFQDPKDETNEPQRG